MLHIELHPASEEQIGSTDGLNVAATLRKLEAACHAAINASFPNAIVTHTPGNGLKSFSVIDLSGSEISYDDYLAIEHIIESVFGQPELWVVRDYDHTRRQRQAARREALNAAAKKLGYDTWAKYETAIINDKN